MIQVEMHFLPDIFVTCDVCHGKRYNHETLEVRYKGLNIFEVLDLTVSQAREFFSNFPSLARKLAILEDVGLGYIRLGQSATTLSGGEAQRIKISRELGKRSLPGTMYILDDHGSAHARSRQAHCRSAQARRQGRQRGGH